MAQASMFVMKYTGAVLVLKGKPYAGADFSLGNVMQMKTKGVSVSIDSMDAFTISYDDIGYVDTNVTYIFTKDCTIAFGDMTEVV